MNDDLNALIEETIKLELHGEDINHVERFIQHMTEHQIPQAG